MKRLELVLAMLGAVLLLAAWWLLRGVNVQWQQETIEAGGCRVPMSVYEEKGGTASVVVLHGLTANRRIMQPLGAELARGGDLRVYMVDLPGHGDNKEPFSYERAETCVGNLLEKLEADGRIRADRTVLIGHSMGASIAIRMADRFPTAATISISASMRKPDPAGGNPIPVELPRRIPVDLLLITGEYDFARTTGANEKLLAAAEGERYTGEDFRQRRAVKYMQIPSASHTGLILNDDVCQDAREWIERSLPGVALRGPCSLGRRLLLAGLGLIGLMLLFPAAASASASLFRASREHKETTEAPSAPRMLAVWVATAVLAVVLLKFVAVLQPVVRMYTGGYLASVLFLVGVALLLMQPRWAGQAAPLRHNWSPNALLMAATLGLATMLAFGALLNWQFADAWLNGPRWWRFALLVPLMIPYAFAEEIALGALPAEWTRRTARAFRFLALRAVLWLAMALGYLALKNGEVLILLLVIYLAAFSIAQRLGADAVRRRTGSAAAAALFGAILAAWFIAAVFPIT